MLAHSSGTVVDRAFSTAIHIAGVELGGTKCICTLASDPNTIVAQEVVETGHPDETLPALSDILERWQRIFGFRALGIASFGPLCLDMTSEHYGHILATNKPDWSMVDVLGRLSGHIGVPIAFDTDVNGAAFAEIAWGAGHELSDFAYVTVGTGIGVGLIVNGKPTRGIGHSELGHMRVARHADDNFVSTCRFHADCVEGLASGSAIKARLGAQHIIDIGADDPVWSPVIDALATLCHNMVCSTGPMRIAMGGGVMNRQPHLLARIEARLIESLGGYMALPDGSHYIVAPTLGTQAGPLGSVALGLSALHPAVGVVATR